MEYNVEKKVLRYLQFVFKNDNYKRYILEQEYYYLIDRYEHTLYYKYVGDGASKLSVCTNIYKGKPQSIFYFGLSKQEFFKTTTSFNKNFFYTSKGINYSDKKINFDYVIDKFNKKNERYIKLWNIA